MPDKLERCINRLKSEGRSVGSAWAISSAALERNAGYTTADISGLVKGLSDEDALALFTVPGETGAGELQKFQVFFKFDKAVESLREVAGVAAEEAVDKTGEIMDYASSKKNFMSWSKEIAALSGGKSQGNLREMHSNIAAGLISKIEYDDENKKIRIVCKVVNDSSWEKVVAGVLCGFSVGGEYVRRWADPKNRGVVRYEAKPMEVSLVDNPAMGGASFDYVRASGLTVKVGGNVKKNDSPTGAAGDAPANATPGKYSLQQCVLDQTGRFGGDAKKAEAVCGQMARMYSKGEGQDMEIADLDSAVADAEKAMGEGAGNGEGENAGGAPATATGQAEANAESTLSPEGLMAMITPLLDKWLVDKLVEVGLVNKVESADTGPTATFKPALDEAMGKAARADELKKFSADLGATLTGVLTLEKTVDTLATRVAAIEARPPTSGPVLREAGVAPDQVRAAVESNDAGVIQKLLNEVPDNQPQVREYLRRELTAVQMRETYAHPVNIGRKL